MRFIFGLKAPLKSQRGFTLLETMISLCITGFVALSVVTTIYQLQGISDLHFAHITAVTQVENAIHYMNRDVQSAQIITPQGTQGFPLSLTWVSWDTNDTNKVTYSLVNDTPPLTTYQLVRKFQLNQNPSTSTTIARYIVSYPSCATTVAVIAASPGNTVLHVVSTSSFPSTASLVLPGEPIPVTYSGKTSNSFTGIPSSGSGSITITHAIGQSVTTYSSYSSYDSADHKLILQLTSDTPVGGKQDEETRQLVIIPRPGS